MSGRSTGSSKFFNLPQFGNKFSPKKASARKWPSLSNLNLDSNARQNEFGLDYGPVKINLGGQTITFDDGQWIPSGKTGASQKELNHLRSENQQLLDENSLLKLKVEILLDMAAEATLDVHVQENEIEQLKKHIHKK